MQLNAATRLRVTASPVYTKLNELVRSVLQTCCKVIINRKVEQAVAGELLPQIIRSIGKPAADGLEKILQADASTALWQKMLSGTAELTPPLKKAMVVLFDECDTWSDAQDFE